MNEETIVECGARLLGKELSYKQHGQLEQLQQIYKSGLYRVSAYQLGRNNDLFRDVDYSYVTLYSPLDAPQNAEEFLGFIKLTIQSRNYKTSPEFMELLNVIPYSAKQYRLLSQRENEKWQDTLSSLLGDEISLPAPPALRLRLVAQAAILEISPHGKEEFKPINQKKLKEFYRVYGHKSAGVSEPVNSIILHAFVNEPIGSYATSLFYHSPELLGLLNALLIDETIFHQRVAREDGSRLPIHQETLQWQIDDSTTKKDYVILSLRKPDGQEVSGIMAGLPGTQPRVLAHSGLYAVTTWLPQIDCEAWPLTIPRNMLSTALGYRLLQKLSLPIPVSVADKVLNIQPEIVVKCRIIGKAGERQTMQLHASASMAKVKETHIWYSNSWIEQQNRPEFEDKIVVCDSSGLERSAAWFLEMPLQQDQYDSHGKHEMRVTKAFPDQFIEWMRLRPRGINVLLDKELDALLKSVVSGSVKLEIVESSSGIDWFDIHVDITVSDTTLSKEEIALLLKAKGKWVQLADKGWRKLVYELSEEVEKELAEIGLSAREITGEKHKLHALQLSALTAHKSKLLSDGSNEKITRRIEDIQTRVTPAIPSAICASLRPYQEEGYHFLSYLSANRFGGVLADDMGLGKTLQALTWLAWLRSQYPNQLPSLVIAPKSVQDNWAAEAQRFYPELRVSLWKAGDTVEVIDTQKMDLLIINYAQLRARFDTLNAVSWAAVIVDEAQNIKNPTSQSAQCACALKANFRLALTGTPIENRLMDLWSIFAFAMPGVLGSRAAFSRNFDNQDDPHARRRLAARTRPFLLRRTKNEVAKDLPDRIEEDISVEMEGVQHKLYQAELKRAKAHLLKASIPGQLDKLRFHLLTSLLRLRQICCHTGLVGLEQEEEPIAKVATKRAKKTSASASAKTTQGTSAKLEALMELLEPLMEEGQKVLVFSQFVQMLELIRQAIEQRGWNQFLLTGKTNERGSLVKNFQESEGAGVFLISLKAGGSGLNLTAASYVVLFDPWWNPAVEAQAIDRTHRIGQKSTVIAYRLITRHTIEQKIRNLQKQKSAVANDILGEENFAKALTLADFDFLLG